MTYDYVMTILVDCRVCTISYHGSKYNIDASLTGEPPAEVP